MRTKTVKKVLLFGLILSLVILGGGYVGYRAYKSARQAHLIAQARNYLAKPNARKALLCLQRALRYNPKDVEACRLMAEVFECGRSPNSLLWRARVVGLNPHSLDDRLALAQSAIIFRYYGVATNALQGVDAADKKTAAYQNVAGVVAAAANQIPEAEAHFVEAARLEPQNLAPQLNLAVVRLNLTNAPALADARAVLQRISSNPTNSALRCQALRELARDAIRHKQADAALALSERLLQETNSVFTDRLLRLDLLKVFQSAEFKPALADFQRDAGTNIAELYELSKWQMARTGPAETLAWLRTLPANTRTNQAVALQIAECHDLLHDWKGLQASIEKQHWDAEYRTRGLHDSRPAWAGLDWRRPGGMAAGPPNRHRLGGALPQEPPRRAPRAQAACGTLEMAKRDRGNSLDHRQQFPPRTRRRPRPRGEAVR